MDTFFVNCGTKIALLTIKCYLCPLKIYGFVRCGYYLHFIIGNL